MPSPIPRLPPVTTMLRMLARMMPRRFSGGREIERSNEAYGRRHLVLRKAVTADLQDFVLELEGSLIGLIAPPSEDHVGDDDGTGDGILSSAHERHADIGMAVDDGLDLLGMHLQSPDVDDPAPPSDEKVTPAAQFDDVAGIEESFRIEQRPLDAAQIAARGSGRTDAQRAVDHLHLHAAGAAADDACGKAFA